MKLANFSGFPYSLEIGRVWRADFESVGKGAAINVDLAYGFQPSDKPFRQWRYPLFTSEESYSFLLRPSDFNKLAKQYDSLVVRGTCEDIFGQKHEINERIDLKEVHRGWSESMMILEHSLEDRVKDISEEMKRVGREIRDTTRNRRTFPVYAKLGSLEIHQPPLQSVLVFMDGIEFFGETLDDKIYSQLSKFKEGTVEEIYCSDRHGMIVSGVHKIKSVERKKQKIGKKVIYSFNVSLEYKK